MKKQSKAVPLIGRNVAVVWEDAWQSMEYFDLHDIKQAPPLFITSVGTCIRDDAAAVTLAMDNLPDGRYRTTKIVPRSMVRHLTVLTASKK